MYFEIDVFQNETGSNLRSIWKRFFPKYIYLGKGPKLIFFKTIL
jgi:hypothetical protein